MIDMRISFTQLVSQNLLPALVFPLWLAASPLDQEKTTLKKVNTSAQDEQEQNEEDYLQH